MRDKRVNKEIVWISKICSVKSKYLLNERHPNLAHDSARAVWYIDMKFRCRLMSGLRIQSSALVSTDLYDVF